MADPIFERYKEALRAGHVAALRGRLDDALAQYRVAAAIAPDRPLPHLGIAEVLLRLGRTADALAACQTALARAPGDAATVELESRIHEASGDRAAAAASLDRLVALLVDGDRPDAALAAAMRARDLDASPERVRRVEDLERAWLASGGTLPLVTPAAALASIVAAPPPATRLVSVAPPGAHPVPDAGATPAEGTVGAADVTAGTGEARAEADEAPAPGAMVGEAPEAAEAAPTEPVTSTGPEPAALAEAPGEPAETGNPAEPGAPTGTGPGLPAAPALAESAPELAKSAPELAEAAPAEAAPAEATPGEATSGANDRPAGDVVGTGSGPRDTAASSFRDVAAAEELSVAAERRSASGDPAEAARLHVRAADAYLAIDAVAPAFEECLLALAVAPGDVDVHLAIARVHAASGRRDRAEATIGLLERLLALDGDEASLARAAAARQAMR